MARPFEASPRVPWMGDLSMRIKETGATQKDVKNEGCSQYLIENKVG